MDVAASEPDLKADAHPPVTPERSTIGYRMFKYKEDGCIRAVLTP
jgi:hypothetical protein